MHVQSEGALDTKATTARHKSTMVVYVPHYGIDARTTCVFKLPGSGQVIGGSTAMSGKTVTRTTTLIGHGQCTKRVSQ